MGTELLNVMQGPRIVDVMELVELETAAPRALVPHFNPRTNALAITSASYGPVWVWSLG